MSTIPNWQYDELQIAGKDYTEPAAAQGYDVYMENIGRFVEQENAEIIAELGLNNNMTLLDIGSGTGAFSIQAAKHCAKVYSVDVAQAMLDCAREKAEDAGVGNIEFLRQGFLTYEHMAGPVDVIVSMIALHHLPDFWKFFGLQRLAKMLKPKGKLYLKDVIFDADINDFTEYFEVLCKESSDKNGVEFMQDLEMHLRDEYSTFDWIIEGMLRRAGFTILRQQRNNFIISYLCEKTEE